MRTTNLLPIIISLVVGIQTASAQFYIEEDTEYDKAMTEKWLEGVEFKKGYYRQFNYILLHFVAQGRAEMMRGDNPNNYEWRCTSLKEPCKLPEALETTDIELAAEAFDDLKNRRWK
jgi:hypothetical protein